MYQYVSELFCSFLAFAICLAAATTLNAQLIITQYIEDAPGGAFYKGIEIANVSGQEIDFKVNPLEILQRTNSNSTRLVFTVNEGVVADKEVLVIGTTAIESYVLTRNIGTRFYHKNFTFNGNDALLLRFKGEIIDVFGDYQSNPGIEWAANGISTRDQNIGIKKGIDYPDEDGWKNPTERFELVSDGNDPKGFGLSPFDPKGMGPHFPDLYYSYDFENQNLKPWTEYQRSGSASWSVRTFADNYYAEISAYGGEDKSDVWLISPIFDLRRYYNKKIFFKYAKRYEDVGLDEEITLHYSYNYEDNLDPRNYDWYSLEPGFDYLRNTYTFDALGPIDIDSIDQKYVRFAFRYQSSGTTNKSSSIIQIDDFVLIGDEIKGIPVMLQITEINPNPVIQNSNFVALIESLDTNGIPQKVNQPTKVNLDLVHGTGSLTGILSDTIGAGEFSTTIAAKYTMDSDFVIKARDADDQLQQSRERLLTTARAPSHLTIENLYVKGHVGVQHPIFYIYARNPDGSINEHFDNFKVYFNLINISTDQTDSIYFSKTFHEGRAVFHDIYFTSVGDYKVFAESESIISDTISVLSIKDTPILVEKVVPRYLMGYYDSDLAYQQAIPSWSLVQLRNLHPDTEYRLYTSGSDYNYLGNNDLNSLQQGRADLRGLNMNYYFETGEYWYNGKFGLFNKKIMCDEQQRYSIIRTGPDDTSKEIWVSLAMNSSTIFESDFYSSGGEDSQVWWVVTLGNRFGDRITSLQTESSSILTKFWEDPFERINSATGFYDQNSMLDQNTFLAFYDTNVSDRRPFTTCKVETGKDPLQQIDLWNELSCTAISAYPPSAPQYYNDISGYYKVSDTKAPSEIVDFVAGAAGGWATFIPNNETLSSIVQYSNNGMVANTWENPDGIWNDRTYDMQKQNPGGSHAPIPFKTPLLRFINLNNLNGQNLCNDNGFIDIELVVRGISSIDIIVEKYKGNKSILFDDIDVASYTISDTMSLKWFVEPYEYTEIPIRLLISDSKDYKITDSSDFFIVYNTPQIISQSKSGVYCAGEDLFLTSQTSGTDHTVQWYKDDFILHNRTDNDLLITDIGYDDSGTYSFEVLGRPECQIKKSDPIVIHVTTPTEIVEQPRKLSSSIGGSAEFTFSAHANGLPPSYRLDIQWYLDDIPLIDNDRISGSQSNILHINNIQSSDFDYSIGYYARVIGRCDTAWTDTVELEQTSIIIKNFTKVENICQGQDIAFKIDAEASDGQVLSYQWLKNGNELINNSRIVGVYQSEIQIKNVNFKDKGIYSVLLQTDNGLQSTNSSTFSFDVESVPKLTKDLKGNLSLKEGDSLKLSILASSNNPLVYSWYRDRDLLISNNMPYYYIDSAQMKDTGLYHVIVANDCGTVTSSNINVEVTDKVSSIQPSFANYSISKPTPNPAIDYFDIELSLADNSVVVFELLSNTGRLLHSFPQGNLSEGHHLLRIKLDKLDIASGIYHLRLKIKDIYLFSSLKILK